MCRLDETSNGRPSPQYECLCDGRANARHTRRRERCWAGRCGGNARNRVSILTTDMRTTQGQTAFGHNVQTIITYYNKVNLFYNMYRCWTCLFSARPTHLLVGSNIYNKSFGELF
jgi:hypothetical protein